MTVALPLAAVPAWSHAGDRAEAGQWARAVMPVAAVHAVVIVAAMLWTGPPAPVPPPDQPIAVELAPMPVADELATAATPAAASAAASASQVPAAASPAVPSAAVPLAAAPPVLDAPVAVPLPSVRVAPSLPATKPGTGAGAGSGGEAAGHPLASGSTGSGAGTAGNTGVGAASGSGDAGAVWRGLIQRHVDRHKTYPAAARMMKREGRVTLSIRINREGRILDASIAKGTGFRPIDDEALATLRRAEPLPTPPAELPGASIPLTLPIGFYLPR